MSPVAGHRHVDSSTPKATLYTAAETWETSFAKRLCYIFAIFRRIINLRGIPEAGESTRIMSGGSDCGASEIALIDYELMGIGWVGGWVGRIWKVEVEVEVGV